MARTYGRKPSSGELAALWARIPAGQQREIIRGLRAALREVRNAGSVDTVHLPFSGVHSHAHHAYKSQGGDQNHNHEHSHDNDADHDHGHEQAAAKTGRHVRFQRGQVVLMNSARKPSTDTAWDRLVRDIGAG